MGSVSSSRIYSPRANGSENENARYGSGGLQQGAELLAKVINEKRLKRQEAKAELDKQTAGKAADFAKDMELEKLKQQNRTALAELKAKLTVKHGDKKKYKDPDMLEQFMLTKGHFPAAMKVKKTAKGTDNPFAEYTPEDETKHIANLAKIRGWEPDQQIDMPAGHTGGVMGIGGSDVPARVIQTYKPGANAGGSIDVAPEPTVESEPETES